MRRLLSVVLLSMLLCTSAVTGAIPCTHSKFNNNPDNFQFAIVADRTGGHRAGIFKSAITKLNLLQPEFVMSVGDLIEGASTNTDPNSLNKMWNEFDSIVQKLQMPFFYVPGNHDTGSQTMLKLWKERLGEPYYHFIYRDVLFLCLDSEDPPTGTANLSQEQLSYFQNILEKNPSVRWTFLFVHRPDLWSNETESWTIMEQMLKGRSYTVFAGHWHRYSKITRAGQDYYVLATTGGSVQPMNMGVKPYDHITWVTMTDKGPTIANLALDGIAGDNPQNPQKEAKDRQKASRP